MPARPQRPCARPGCPQLVTPPQRYCEAHVKLAKQQEAERERLYDRQQRDQRIVKFYHSLEWQALRLRALERDAYLCQPCLREKRITRADTVHHIVPIKQDFSRRLDPSNVESVCRACHNRLHERGAVRQASSS